MDDFFLATENTGNPDFRTRPADLARHIQWQSADIPGRPATPPGTSIKCAPHPGAGGIKGWLSNGLMNVNETPAQAQSKADPGLLHDKP
jgi:hypothetical protein